MNLSDRQQGHVCRPRVGANESDRCCLVCAVNLKTDGRSYKHIFDNHGRLCRLLEAALNVEMDEDLPSAFLCHKCERMLRRIDRHEAERLRTGLEHNLLSWPPPHPQSGEERRDRFGFPDLTRSLSLDGPTSGGDVWSGQGSGDSCRGRSRTQGERKPPRPPNRRQGAEEAVLPGCWRTSGRGLLPTDARPGQKGRGGSGSRPDVEASPLRTSAAGPRKAGVDNESPGRSRRPSEIPVRSRKSNDDGAFVLKAQRIALHLERPTTADTDSPPAVSSGSGPDVPGRRSNEFSKRKDIDQKPLINSEWQVRENKDFDDIESRDSGIWTPELENENLDSETMPFAFLKRKPSEPKASPVQEAKTTENVEEKPATETVQVEKSELSREISNCLVNGEVKKPETESEELTEIDGGAVVAPIDGEPKEETAMVDDEKADVELVPVVEQQSEKPKVESTPLIKKESDAKGTQPGFLCCTIL